MLLRHSYSLLLFLPTAYVTTLANGNELNPEEAWNNATAGTYATLRRKNLLFGRIQVLSSKTMDLFYR